MKGIGDFKGLSLSLHVWLMYAGRITKTFYARTPRSVQRDFSYQSNNIKAVRKIYDITKKLEHHIQLKDQISKIKFLVRLHRYCF